MNNLTKGDKIIVAAVLSLALFVYVIFTFYITAGAPDEVQIFVDGKLYASYSLQNFKEEKNVEIKSEFGTNVLKISNDGAEMLSASCPDKRDVMDGKITKSGQTIICMPNRVMVKLLGNNDEVDRVTY